MTLACRSTTIILNSVHSTSPQLGLMDMSEVDVILISNYHCMMALPYMTEYTNFKGVVYATEPTLHIGR